MERWLGVWALALALAVDFDLDLVLFPALLLVLTLTVLVIRCLMRYWRSHGLLQMKLKLPLLASYR